MRSRVDVAERILQDPLKLAAIVHVDTSTGILSRERDRPRLTGNGTKDCLKTGRCRSVLRVGSAGV